MAGHAVDLQAFLDNATVSPEIFHLRPDYRVLLLAISGIPSGGPSDSISDTLLREAESCPAVVSLGPPNNVPVTQLPHIAAWRDAYKAFGTKPQKFRNSLEALTRRAATTGGGGGGGLPRVNRLTDIYNAISVKHQIPFGGEDLDTYVGWPRLIRATGQETFETTAEGKTVKETVEKGEVVWCDEKGVTCRRWNWRQGPRTALNTDTKRAVFILDLLEPVTDDQVGAAADELIDVLKGISPELKCVRRLIGAASAAAAS